MKQITFIMVQADNVVLWGNPAGALWNKSVPQRTKSVTQGRVCVPVCYEAAVPNKEFQSLKEMGISWTATLTQELTSIIFLTFPISPKITPQTPTTLPLLPSPSISPPLLAFPSLPAWPSQCLWPVYGYSVSAGDRVQACFWRLSSSL